MAPSVAGSARTFAEWTEQADSLPYAAEKHVAGRANKTRFRGVLFLHNLQSK